MVSIGMSVSVVFPESNLCTRCPPSFSNLQALQGLPSSLSELSQGNALYPGSPCDQCLLHPSHLLSASSSISPFFPTPTPTAHYTLQGPSTLAPRHPHSHMFLLAKSLHPAWRLISGLSRPKGLAISLASGGHLLVVLLLKGLRECAAPPSDACINQKVWVISAGVPLFVCRWQHGS